MMRGSFQDAMSLERHNRFDTLSNHLEFFSRYDPKDVQVAIDTRSSTIAGCIVQTGNEIEQLYVHTQYQRKGIGSSLMTIAKTSSPNRLELYTFQQNTQAQAFYKQCEFNEMARGTASFDGNSWATSPEQLADIRFVWLPS